MDGFDFDLAFIQQTVEMVIVAGINALANGISAIAGLIPNPDPFPAIIDGLSLGQDSAGATAYYFLNQFFDLATIVGVFLAWIPMFGMGWLIQTLWNWGKAKNKG